MIRKLLSAKPRFWLFMLLLLVIVSIGTRSLQNNHISRQTQQIEELQAQRLELIQTNTDIQHKIDFTLTDTYIDREARSKLRLVKPGEILFEALD